MCLKRCVLWKGGQFVLASICWNYTDTNMPPYWDMYAQWSVRNYGTSAACNMQCHAVITRVDHDNAIKWKLFRVTGPFAVNSPFTGEFSSQRPVTRSYDVFSDLRLNKWLNTQSWGWWFETPSGSLWRHRNDITQIITIGTHLARPFGRGAVCLF